jgi:hypothetical protein
VDKTAKGDAARRDSTALCRPINGPTPIETGTTEIFHTAVRQHCRLGCEEPRVSEEGSG